MVGYVISLSLSSTTHSLTDSLAQIHAVYTPEDSLVFGGNFLHSFSATMQLDVYRIERESGVSKKYTFPMYEQMIAYVLDQLVLKLKDRNVRRECVKDAAGSMNSLLRTPPPSFKRKKRRHRCPRSKSAWQIFVKERTDDLNSGLNATVLVKRLSAEWKQMTNRRKEYYIEKSRKLKELFELEQKLHEKEKKEEEEEEEEEEDVEIDIPNFDEKDLLTCLQTMEGFAKEARNSNVSNFVKSRTRLWRARRDFDTVLNSVQKRKTRAIEVGDDARKRFLNVSRRLLEMYDVACDEKYAEIEREHVTEMTWQVDPVALISEHAVSAIGHAVEWLLKHESAYPLVSRDSLERCRNSITQQQQQQQQQQYSYEYNNNNINTSTRNN